MRKRIWQACVAAAGLAMTAGVAQAAVVTYVYEGKASGNDLTGLFGLPAEFGDVAFVATFRRNTSVPGGPAGPDKPHESSVHGALTASLQINGVTWNFAPTSSEQWQFDKPDDCGPGCDYERFRHEVVNNLHGPGPVVEINDSFLRLGADGLGANVLPSLDYRTLPSIGDMHDLKWLGEFKIYHLVIDMPNAQSVLSEASGTLYPEKLTVYAAAVPEPATWALMILGFGGAGAMLRGRRAHAPA